MQVTIFLPDALSTEIDALRRSWDPVMAARISPHVTLLHRVADPVALPRRLQEFAPTIRPFRLGLSSPRRWASPDDGVYLPVTDLDGGLGRLRAHLLGPTPDHGVVVYEPHLTLVHHRTGRPHFDEAWRCLSAIEVREEFSVDTIALIEQSTDQAWRVTDTVSLG